tara:strand:- start:1069 stop:1512 length:444 start_codon:yes stop_codon:yes gene_type:complete
MELKSNKYFVQLTNNIINNLKTDFYRFNYPWTRKYEPVKIIERTMIEDVDIDMYKLDEFVKKYMKLYGIDNVRGGKYNTIKLESESILELKLIENNYIGIKNRNNNSFINVWFCNHCGKDFISKQEALSHEANFHENDERFENYLCC